MKSNKHPSLPCRIAPCSNCPFRKDSLEGWLGEARAKELSEATSFVCHKDTNLQCAGHMLLMEDHNTFRRLAIGFKIPLNLKGRKLVFDTPCSFIKHHE